MPKIINIDEFIDQADEPLVTAPFVLFGRDWRVVCDLNAFAIDAAMGGEPGAITKVFGSLIHPDEKAEFFAAMTAARLTPEQVDTVLGKMFEAAAERPTKRPSASGAGGRSQKSPPKSAASSSRRPAGR